MDQIDQPSRSSLSDPFWSFGGFLDLDNHQMDSLSLSNTNNIIDESSLSYLHQSNNNFKNNNNNNSNDDDDDDDRSLTDLRNHPHPLHHKSDTIDMNDHKSFISNDTIDPVMISSNFPIDGISPPIKMVNNNSNTNNISTNDLPRPPPTIGEDQSLRKKPMNGQQNHQNYNGHQHQQKPNNALKPLSSSNNNSSSSSSSSHNHQNHPSNHPSNNLPELTKRKDWERRLIDDLEDLILIIKSDGTIQFISKSFKKLLSQSSSTLSLSSQEMMIIGKSIYDQLCFDGLDVQNLRNQIKIISNEPGSTLHCFLRFKKIDSIHGFIILEITGHLIEHSTLIQECREELIYLSGRLHPSSFSKLQDHFLELLIENQRMMEIIAASSSSSSPSKTTPVTTSPTVKRKPSSPLKSTNGDPSQTSALLQRRVALEKFDRQIISSRTCNGNDPQRDFESSSVSPINRKASKRLSEGYEDETMVDGTINRGATSAKNGISIINGNDQGEEDEDQDLQLKVGSKNFIRDEDIKINEPTHQTNGVLNGNLSSAGLGKKANQLAIEFVCKECGVTDSPEWRKGPMGRKTLCNACGLRWAKKSK